MGRKVIQKIICSICKRGMTPYPKNICKRCRKKGIDTFDSQEHEHDKYQFRDKRADLYQREEEE